MTFPYSEQTRVRINVTRREQKLERLARETRVTQLQLAEDKAELARLEADAIRTRYAQIDAGEAAARARGTAEPERVEA